MEQWPAMKARHRAERASASIAIKNKQMKERIGLVRGLSLLGVSLRDAASKIGVHKTTLVQLVRKYGIQWPTGPLPENPWADMVAGHKQARANLSAQHEAERVKIVECMAAQRITQTKAAEILGTTSQVINAIIREHDIFWPVKRQGRTKANQGENQ